MMNLTQIGFTHAHTDVDKRNYYFSNVMNLTVIVTMIILFFASMWNQVVSPWRDTNFSQSYMITFIVVALCSALSIVLNGKGGSDLARIIQTTLVPCIMLFLPPILISEIRVDMYLFFPYTPIGFMVMLHYLYAGEKDKRWLLFFAFLYMCIALFSFEILDLFNNNQEALEFRLIVRKYPVSHRFVPVVLYFVVFFAIYYSFSKSRKFEENLISTKKELELKNIALAETVASKDKFHSIMAHDLRGPFNSVLGLTKIMRDNADTISHDELRNYTNILYSSCENTQKLLENLLQWSHLQTGGMKYNPENIDLYQLTKHNLELLQAMSDDKNIKLNNKCQDGAELYADRNMIKTIIRNLTVNAIKFTPEGGHIDISCDRADDYVSIIIADSGVGMSDKLISKLFRIEEKVTSLGTNEEKGTGLGLLLVKEFVDKHNGEIIVESTIGKGSKFIVNIPRTPH
ncbi:MAG: HAMP domain-containing histidine kinase [Reichenbachiella sp.]